MRKLLALLALLALLGTSSVAQAVPTLDFNIDALHPAGVSISYAGGATPLVGTNIGVDSVVGINSTPANNGVMQAITGGVLAFTTGNFVAGSNPWDFGGGGSLSITGAVPGITPPAGGIPAGTVLLTGTFTEAHITVSGTDFRIAASAFLNTVNAALASYYGLVGGPGTGWSGNFNISFTAAGAPPGAFTSSAVLSGDLTTSPLPTPPPVPEPASIVMLSIGAVGFAGYGWRKRRMSRLAVA